MDWQEHIKDMTLPELERLEAAVKREITARRNIGLTVGAKVRHRKDGWVGLVTAIAKSGERVKVKQRYRHAFGVYEYEAYFPLSSLEHVPDSTPITTQDMM